MNEISRRAFLGGLAAVGAGCLLPRPVWLKAQTIFTPENDVNLLESRVMGVIDGEDMGFDLRRIDWQSGRVDFRIQHNPFKLYPVASCFKAMVVLYYLTLTPQELWEIDESSAAYRVAVYSNNPRTGELLQRTAEFYPGSRNPIVKFNNWVTEMLSFDNGLHSWNWPGSATIGFSDPRYAANMLTRSVQYRGNRYLIDNVYYVSELSELWSHLLTLRPLWGERQAQIATQQMLELFAIPAESYQSPIERAWGRYIGKDGVIPAGDSPLGVRVMNDCGIILIENTPYVVSGMSLGGEFRFVEKLRRILEHVAEFEARRSV